MRASWASFVAGAIAGGSSVAVYVLWMSRRRRRLLFLSAPYKCGEYGIGVHPVKDGDVTIRLATPGDAHKMIALIQGLALYERKPISTVEVTEANLVADGFGPNPRFHCLLAEIDNGDAIGFAFVYPSYSTWQGLCHYLEDLFVDEKHRGRGLGALLLKSVAAIAYAQGCKRLHWNALDWNTPALKFYESVGAKRLDEWVTLRMGRPEIAALLGRSS
ncbi:hypothetical protein CTAYLR_006473 [Chrysophaeum taylorii]|uniref:N-acetyltransferase domain-containing protein n=1 Tax=Chrysophaeum taylorii TaxID=2483200 RepID=A0AAD7UKS3_9STRA|nr:hypothetical protein CTAYLR_006473 [Chrysophaeum taylorii]